MRGEHRWMILPLSPVRGSSPHARGTPTAPILPDRHERTIPACAGNTTCHCDRTRSARDHPRMRGEHLSCPFSRGHPRGSSPHARGTPYVKPVFREVWGIIPACAGNTAIPIGTIPSTRDHPRMRGEHITPNPFADAVLGSSPHARGTHHPVSFRGCSAGIIPACAGNTLRK